MLQELKVTHFAIIDQIHLNFRMGFNILTGETGAGKSIILKSLALLMGERAEGDDVRTGQDQAVVEGLFDISARSDIEKTLKDLGVEVQDHQLVVRRLISASGKGKVYLNGSISTVADLRKLVSPLVEVAGANIPLIEMTGQHENRNLTARSYHLDILDQMAGTFVDRHAYSTVFKEYLATKSELQEFEIASQNRAQRLDFLDYQLKEFQQLELEPGDEEKIESEARRARSMSRLTEGCDQLANLLTDAEESILTRLQVAVQKSIDLKKVDSSLPDLSKDLSQAITSVQEASYNLSQYQQSLVADEGSLNELEDKLNRLRGLQRKYGQKAEDIIAARDKIALEHQHLQGADQRLIDLRAQIKKQLAVIDTQAQSLHERRLKAARKFEKLVNEELKDLNMKGVTIEFKLERLTEPSITGQTLAEIHLRTGTEELRPLSKTASGGELSRILLAIKRIAGKSKYPRTYLFDEVDTGVSGPTAEKVGLKLAEIARGQQVICVTHLPQVASFGDSHFLISKGSTSGKQMQVTELKREERVQEIARLISGEKISKTSLAHARQLLSEGREMLEGNI